MHVRTGYLWGDYSGVISGTVKEATSVDLEFEQVYSNKNSYFFRTTAVFDTEQSIFRHFYLGGGMKYYLGSKAMLIEAESKETIFKVSPRWRFYVGFDLGISHIVLKTFGELLQISTSAYEYGPMLGTIYNVTARLGLELNATVQVSTGFTTVSTGGVTYKGMAGLSYFVD